MECQIVYFTRPRNIENFATTFRDVAAAGIGAVVLASRMGDVDLMQRHDLLRAKACLSELGLLSPAIHGLHSGYYDPNEAHDARRVEMRKAHLCLLEHAADMGCRTYVCHPGPIKEGGDRKASWNRVRETLDQLVTRAASLGIIIALENANPGNLGDDANELRAFVEDYGCPSVKICFDSGHAHRAEDAPYALRVLSPHVVTVHLHDNDKSADQHLLPGNGTIPWDVLVPLIRECPQLLHTETEPFNTENWSAKRIYRLYSDVLSEQAH